MSKGLYRVLLIVFVAIFCISGGLLVDYYIKSRNQKNLYEDLSSLVEQIQQGHTPIFTDPSQNTTDSATETTSSEFTESTQSTEPTEPIASTTPTEPAPPLPTHVFVKHPVTGKIVKILREYAPIFNMNPDLVGWIKIDGTNINYPVMQTPDRPNYYLTRDFYGKNSKHGCIYAAEAADINAPSDNITIYGHKMLDGSMFAALHNYKDTNFYKKYPYITFDTLTEHHTYQILSVFQISATVEAGFPYHTFVNGDEATFGEFVKKCKTLSLYNTGVDAVYGDKLITLSTCDRTISYGRLVVVAKRSS